MMTFCSRMHYRGLGWESRSCRKDFSRLHSDSEKQLLGRRQSYDLSGMRSETATVHITKLSTGVKASFIYAGAAPRRMMSLIFV